MKQDNQKIKYLLYCRKSTDDKDRQILSIESQISALLEIAKREGLEIVDTFIESKSAKAPGREKFDEMLARIERGEANGIACWKLDRLARNPVDEGRVRWLLQREIIKKIKTYEREYYPNDNVLIASFEFGMANQFVRDLSVGVKRGMEKKAAMGWRPGIAPLGYLNSKTKLKGEQDVAIDPQRFHLVRQMFQIMLTGSYTMPKLLIEANRSLGLTMPATRNRPERKLQLSTLHRILIDPFYYGCYEWPHGSGNWIKGNHESMITEEEFDRIQFLLGRKGRPRPKTHRFAFTGIMRCGGCGYGITAQERFKTQLNGNMHHYIHYRCSKKGTAKCDEKYLEIKKLDKQFDEILEKVTISERFKAWAIKYLHEIRKDEARAHDSALEAKQKALTKVTRDIENLVLQYTSSDNEKGELLTQQEYQTAKGKLVKEKNSLEVDLMDQGKELENWVELSERTFNFACYARLWFKHGDLETKKAIFACLGYNHTLKAQKIALTLRRPFESIEEKREKIEEELRWFEPLETSVSTMTLGDMRQKFPVLSG
jgi:DNA invertase Pin-like site-specific DNA recombinase